MKRFCINVSLKLLDLCHAAVEVHGIFVSTVFFSPQIYCFEKRNLFVMNNVSVLVTFLFLDFLKHFIDFRRHYIYHKEMQETCSEITDRNVAGFLNIVFEFVINFGFQC